MQKSLIVLAAFSLLLLVNHAHAAEPVARVRVAFDLTGVTSTQVQGLADVSSDRAVTADDPVRIASISKLVTTLGVMRLVEAGTLDLDADVSTLLGWQLRHPQFPESPITLRLLLSHQSSLTDAAGYYAVPWDGQLRDILDDPRAWDTAHAPGTFFRYANLNFPLVASVMERATGKRFDQLMDELVLRPLAIPACFNWQQCDPATAARAVVQYGADRKPVRDDNRGQKPECAVVPAADGSCDLDSWQAGKNGASFSPQGGLRISGNGLAKIGRLLLGEGTVDGVHLLRPESVREMLRPAWSYAPGTGVTSEEDDSGQSGSGFFCRYGLAAQTLASTHAAACHDDPFGDGVARVGHSGSAYGLLSGLWIDRQAGSGVAYFVTGMPEARAGGHSAFSAIEEAMARGE